ncbi:MAG TPA: hypothetical protein ENK54_05780 [Thiotrichales bacterium]|nr:hypothetical protein [Thiotrichales bacterium]
MAGIGQEREAEQTGQPRLPAAAAAWGGEAFEPTLRDELHSLGDALMPLLQAGLGAGGIVTGGPEQVMILSSRLDEEGRIVVRVGVFYRSLIAGCSCADDPAPVEPLEEYCELELAIHRVDGRTSFRPST